MGYRGMGRQTSEVDDLNVVAYLLRREEQ